MTIARAAHLRETDSAAGHVGLELRNVDANYPFERSHRFAGGDAPPPWAGRPKSGQRHFADTRRSPCEEIGAESGAPVSEALFGVWLYGAPALLVAIDGLTGAVGEDENVAPRGRAAS